MTRHQLTSPQGLVKWSGGRMMCGAAGSNALLSAQGLETSQDDAVAAAVAAAMRHQGKARQQQKGHMVMPHLSSRTPSYLEDMCK
ncbi:TPA: hypothetical protein ACH3X1_006735 [Trebouxia sp. C0004]